MLDEILKGRPGAIVEVASDQQQTGRNEIADRRVRVGAVLPVREERVVLTVSTQARYSLRSTSLTIRSTRSEALCKDLRPHQDYAEVVAERLPVGVAWLPLHGQDGANVRAFL